jgi:4-oxalocrotonate tautomerase
VGKVNGDGKTKPSLDVQIEEPQMPLIQVKLIEETFTPTEKKEIATKLTDAMVSIEEENMPPASWVDIEDLSGDEWEIGGLAMTTDAIGALVAGE